MSDWRSSGRAGLAALLAVVAAACGSSPSTQVDARVDASAKDVPADVGTGADADAHVDVTPDVVPDGHADYPLDLIVDVDRDVPSDVAFEAPFDVTPDVGDAPVTVDVPTDAAPNPFAGYHWVTLPAPVGTQVSAITIDSEGTLYAGAGGDLFFSGNPQAGVYKSTDDGASWRPANFGVYDYHVGSLFAAGPTIYAGTGGLLRSTDRGATWLQMTYPDSISVVNSIGAQGDLVMIASTYGGNPCYLSTDGGRTFTSSQFSCSGITSIDVLAAGTVIVRASDSGVVRSTDKGVTFNAVQGIMNGFGLGARVRCDGASTCYAVARTTSSASGPGALLKSTDAGATFVPLSPPAAPSSVLAISDTGSLYVALSSSMIARSDDGGATFELVHRPTTATAFEPNCGGPFVARGDKVYAACPDGVYRSVDKGRHWQAASGTPATGEINGFALGMFVDNTPTALGASGDIYLIANEPLGATTLRRSSDGGWTWQTLVRPFSAGSCVVTPGGSLECTSVTGAASSTLAIGRSDDHGATWRSVAPPTGPSPSGMFSVASFAVAGSVVYAAGNGIARSMDGGLTFTYLAGTPTVSQLQVLRSGHLLAIDSLGTSGYRSTDQGATWQPIDRLYGLPIVEDAAGRLIRYTGASNFEVSTDEGVTWPIQSAQGLPLVIGVNVPMAIDGAGNLFAFGPGPATPGSADRSSGSPWRVVASADGGQHFTPMPDPIPNPNRTSVATDKQGRLIVATTGGVFRLDADGSPGPTRPDTGNPDGGTGGPAPRPLTMVLENAPWTSTAGHPGFAVDANQRVYRMDQNTIYAVDGATVSTYLTMSEVVSGAALSFGSWFEDIDTGPDGQLYVILTGTAMGASTSSDIVVQSSTAHQAALWRVLPTNIAAVAGVIGAGKIGVIDRNGLTIFTTGSAQTVYAPSLLQSTDGNCATQDLATDPSGMFLYLPGCAASGVLRGNADGSGIGVLYNSGYSPADASAFTCAARDPAGGFYMMAVGTAIGGGTTVSPRLYHVAESGSAAASLVHVVTEPSFGEARIARGGTNGGQFGRCAMAVAPNGVIYVQTLKELWKVGP